MTPQEWKEVEERLKSFYEFVKLKCDNYDITLKLERLGQFKNGILVYINGKIKFEWLTMDCEERRRFVCPKKRYIHNQKERKKLKRISKSFPGNKVFDPNATCTVYQLEWTSFQALKRHLIKNNNKIELIKEETNADRNQTESIDPCG